MLTTICQYNQYRKLLDSFPKQPRPATSCNTSYLAEYSSEHLFKPSAFRLSMYRICEGSLAGFKSSQNLWRGLNTTKQCGLSLKYQHEQLLPCKSVFTMRTRTIHVRGRVEANWDTNTSSKQSQIQSNNIPLLVSCFTTERSE